MLRCLLPVALLLVGTGCSCETNLGSDAGPRPDGGVRLDGGGPFDAGSRPDSGPAPDAGPPAAPPDVNVVLTGDNAYGFGYGSADAIRSYFAGREATLAGHIFNCSTPCTTDGECTTGDCDDFGTCNDDGNGPETYVVPGAQTSVGDYLYIVAWSDDAVTQGVLGTFQAVGASVGLHTGDDGWEVCATGVDYDIGAGGPPQSEIDSEIVRCNGGGGVSQGWVGPDDTPMALAIGEANEAGSAGEFPGTCTNADRGDHLGPEARWMWFDRDVTDGTPAFRGGDMGEFLLFRLQVQDVVDLI